MANLLMPAEGRNENGAFVGVTKSGELQHVLVIPAEEIEPRLYQTDAQGRLILPFTNMRSVRDVVVMNVE